MFAYIEGTLISSTPANAILDVQGVGYDLNISINTFESLPEPGNKVKLLTHFLVRDDAQLLYGFVTEDERRLFRLVMKVSGFGTKTAMAVLSCLSPQEFVQIVLTEDKNSLIKVPGIGSRSADRLIVEFRDKIDSLQITPKKLLTANSIMEDAESALVGLGYKPTEIHKVLTQVDVDDDISIIIRQALQLLGKN